MGFTRPAELKAQEASSLIQVIHCYGIPSDAWFYGYLLDQSSHQIGNVNSQLINAFPEQLQVNHIRACLRFGA